MKKIFVFSIISLIISIFTISTPLEASAQIQNSEFESVGNEVEEDNENNVANSRSAPDDNTNYGEKWYNIANSENENLPDLPHAVDYSTMPELLTYLKPGDLLLERNGEIVGDIFHHIAIVVGIEWDEEYQQNYVVLIESVSMGVKYGLLTPTRFEAKEGVLLRLSDATDIERQSAVEWAKVELNKKYSFNFNIVTKNSTHSNPTWYCSELAWAAYFNQGIYLDQDDNLSSGGSIVFPDEIYEYSNAKTILHSDYSTTLEVSNDTYHTYICNGDVYNEPHKYISYNYCFEKCSICNHNRESVSHNYTNRYVSINSSNHYSYCLCGGRIVENHNFMTHDEYEVCTDCGYTVEVNHVHSYLYQSNRDGLSHMKRCSCGDSVREFCIGRSMIDGTDFCMHCGQNLKTDFVFSSLDAILPEDKENAQ